MSYFSIEDYFGHNAPSHKHFFVILIWWRQIKTMDSGEWCIFFSIRALIVGA